jgi:hypothetical protein
MDNDYLTLIFQNLLKDSEKIGGDASGIFYSVGASSNITARS